MTRYNNERAKALYDAFIAMRAAKKALEKALENVGDWYWTAVYPDHFSVDEDFVVNNVREPTRIVCGEFDPLHCIECNEQNRG